MEESPCPPDDMRLCDGGVDGPRILDPALHALDPDFDEARYRRHAARSNAALIPRSLSLAVCVPRSEDSAETGSRPEPPARKVQRSDTYLERLLREIQRIAPVFDRDREVVQILFRDTARFFSAEQIGRIVDSLEHHFHFSRRPDREFLLQLGSGYDCAADIAVLADLGFNRFSIENPSLREPSELDVGLHLTRMLAAISACHAGGSRSVRVSLSAGLPGKPSPTIDVALDRLIDARPERIALRDGDDVLPYEDARPRSEADAGRSTAIAAQSLERAREQLEAAGYRHLGLGEFVLPDDDLARAQSAGRLGYGIAGYTTEGDCDIVGLGVGAISHFGDSYCRNSVLLADWEAAVDRDRMSVCCGIALDAHDRLRGEIIRRLLCQHRIDIAGIEKRCEVSFWSSFADARPGLLRAAADGLLTIDPNQVQITSRGRNVLCIIAQCFDPYSQQLPDPSQTAQSPGAV